jgi:hypothetical protein
MTDLNDRILRAVASCRVQSDVPAEVLKAIRKTCRIIPNEEIDVFYAMVDYKFGDEVATTVMDIFADPRGFQRQTFFEDLEPIRGAGEGA